MNKKMPWKVKLAIIWLLCVYLLIIALLPVVALLIFAAVAVAWSAYQLINYFDN